MKHGLVGVAALVGLVVGIGRAEAVPFDFTDVNGGAPGLLSSSVSDGGVTATGFADFGAGYVSTNLWLRHNDDDNGLGVCSEGESACIQGAGDVNELSNQMRPELIQLSRPANSVWSSLWVSSLDTGGTNGSEKGRVYWSNDANPNHAMLGSFQFGYGDFADPAEGDILTLSAASSFLNTAQYLYFVPDASNGTNNDYLVWKGATDRDRQLTATPEPASLMLVGTGLAGFVARRRRKSRA